MFVDFNLFNHITTPSNQSQLVHGEAGICTQTFASVVYILNNCSILCLLWLQKKTFHVSSHYTSQWSSADTHYHTKCEVHFSLNCRGKNFPLLKIQRSWKLKWKGHSRSHWAVRRKRKGDFQLTFISYLILFKVHSLCVVIMYLHINTIVYDIIYN